MVVMRPIRHAAKTGSGCKHVRLCEQGHQRNKASVGASIDPYAFGIHPRLFHQVSDAIHLVAEVLSSHMTVDSCPPVPSVSCTAAVIYIEYGISVISQEVVEQVFPEIAAPPFMGVLQISCSMDEDDGRVGDSAGLVAFGRTIEPGMDEGPVPCRESNEGRIPP